MTNGSDRSSSPPGPPPASGAGGLGRVIVLPVPGAVAPAEGVGVTLHERDGLLPGTILRAGPRVFWFKLDGDRAGAERIWPAALAWTYRAVRQADGVWREGADMRRVDVGVRRLRLDTQADRGEPGRRSGDQLAREVDRLEPWLLKTRWYPMTYMAIPSVLGSADALLAELARYDGPERERVAALRERLAALRTAFHRVP